MASSLPSWLAKYRTAGKIFNRLIQEALGREQNPAREFRRSQHIILAPLQDFGIQSQYKFSLLSIGLTPLFPLLPGGY